MAVTTEGYSTGLAVYPIEIVALRTLSTCRRVGTNLTARASLTDTGAVA